MISVCNAILHFEALRTQTPEAITADANFLTLIGQCEENCKVIEACQSQVTEVEEAIMIATVRKSSYTGVTC